MKIKIELDINDLINANIPTEKQKELPTVDASYNNEWLSQGKAWYQTYTKGEYRWVRMEGRGESPLDCHDIIIRMSPGNNDLLIDTEMCEHPEYGNVAYDDYPENMYIQAERLRQLEDLGYVKDENNFVELIE